MLSQHPPQHLFFGTIPIEARTDLVTCNDYHQMLQAIRYFLPKSSSQISHTQFVNTWEQILKVFMAPKLEKLVPESYKQREYLQSLLFRSCSNLMFLDQSGIGVANKMKYLSNWKDLGSIKVEPIFLPILFPNGTFVDDVILQESRIIAFNFPQLIVYKEASASFEVVYTSAHNSVHFITCAATNKQTFLSLIGYVSAFDVETWVGILLSFMISGMVFNWKYKNGNDGLIQAAFIYKVLLLQGSNTVEKIRWVGGAWLLSGVILSFFYQGDNINKLTAPLQPRKLESFTELLDENYTLFSPTKISTQRRMLDRLPVLLQFIDIGTFPLPNGFLKPENFLFGNMFIQKEVGLRKDEAILKAMHLMKIPQTLREILEMIKPNYYFQEISGCKKTAYVDTIDNVQQLEFKLRASGIPKASISVSKELYGYIYERWDFMYIPWPADNLLSRAHSLLHSGIVEVWKKWAVRGRIRNFTMLGQNGRGKSLALSIYGNLVVVFYMHFAILAFAFVAFIIEITQRVLDASGNFVNNLEWAWEGILRKFK
ncbi:unnamed protein product [Orchesella dallaii]|uniref:Uncharacterized protein n=1 Tax=Orchesella dallaii TaxID=48710 RepID=A0ABP1QRC4_9HEXA